MYKVYTKYGTTHQYINSYKLWPLDENFLIFDQKGGELIIAKEQILYISSS